MDKVISCCFSAKNVGADLHKHRHELKTALKGTEATETLKIHVAASHIQDCLSYLGNCGLGFWSEQAGESIHREFSKFWERYKIELMDDPTYITRFKKAVIEFSSKHL